MTITIPETGEVIEFDKAAAERRAERITLRLDAIADNYRAVLPLIREAIEKRDDIALGYRSPGEYVADRFGQSLAGLGVDVRRAVVGELTQAGLSTRAIAPVVGADHSTVVRDLQRGGADAPSDPGPIGAEVVEGDAPEATPVTGIDGKTYPRPTPRPEPSAPHRKPLTEAFWHAAYDLIKVAERIDRLAADDRFPQNAAKVAQGQLGDLLRARDLLSKVIDQLTTHQKGTNP